MWVEVCCSERNINLNRLELERHTQKKGEKNGLYISYSNWARVGVVLDGIQLWGPILSKYTLGQSYWFEGVPCVING